MQEEDKNFKSCLTNHSSNIAFVLFCFLGVFVCLVVGWFWFWVVFFLTALGEENKFPW